MQNIMQKAYYVVWTIFLVLFLVLLAFFRLCVFAPEEKKGYEVLTDYSRVIVSDNSLPADVKYVYTFELEGIEKTYNQLMLYSSHQEITIYLDGEKVYEMYAKEVDFSGKTPGHVWNQLAFSVKDNGKQLQIEAVPVYSQVVGVEPTFLFGNKKDIVLDAIWQELPILVLGVIIVVIGLVYITFILFNYKQSDVERSLLMLGNFAMQVGLWKIADTRVISLLFPNYPVVTQIPYIALMLMCISFILFVRELYGTSKHFIWNIPVLAGLLNIVLTLFFQYLGIADMRQMLPVTHVVILLMALVTFVMTVYEVKEIGWTGNVKRNVFCLSVCFLGAVLDMVVYYLFNGQVSTVLGMLGFMVYIVILGFASMKEIKKLMDIGIKAERYEKMAYHDQLTGLYNRTAFAEHTSRDEFIVDKCIIVVMDLNNLKSCNDQMGHDKGDIYIKECARMIQESFGDIGRCYRMGGDEFNVLLENGDLYLCKQRLKELQKKVADCDKVGGGFRMGIACGYKMYDRLLDYDIHETARRADKVMYQEKFAMKEL